uniref:Uncharacterized protein n=1 Tax=Tanacetum cinerariifolium TaxID=118510 RepID=A0A6L2KPT7_TANCI|nr:hypothetical protein [Tanacetum cinerariifolium]
MYDVGCYRGSSFQIRGPKSWCIRLFYYRSDPRNQQTSNRSDLSLIYFVFTWLGYAGTSMMSDMKSAHVFSYYPARRQL